jgi:hypothetical protein
MVIKAARDLNCVKAALTSGRGAGVGKVFLCTDT